MQNKCLGLVFFFFKQKTAYEIVSRDWSSDVCSSDLDDFVKMRTERDKTLDMPVLILPSVQVNMRAGAMPPAEDNGVRYLKIPVDAL